MKVLFAAGLLVTLAGCASVDLTPKGRYAVATTEFTWKGETFKAGDHVVVTGRSGTFKPRDTGAATDVNAVPGKTGIVLGGAERDPSIRMSQSEPIQVALVRWDKQMWDGGGEPFELEPFEATIHSEYLDVVK